MNKTTRKILRKPYRLTVKVAKKITNYDQLITENQNLKFQINKLENDNNFGWPNGHFYSPVHRIEDLKQYDKVLNRSKRKFSKTIPGFSEKRIVAEFNDLKTYFKEFNYPKDDDGKCRFYSKNVSLSLMDSLTIFSMIRKYKPKRIIEIGSGFSSALMMEINEKYFDREIDLTFIEPHPELLYERMHKGDKSLNKVIPKGVQDVPLEVFRQLKKDDLLFIDSTHVSKFNSDVNYEIFDILPDLAEGVIIHFHDVLDGFEYPIYWLEKGWAWNEEYLLRAFLMNNNEFEVLLMTNYLTNRYPELLKKSYPKDDVLNGGALWIRKT